MAIINFFKNDIWVLPEYQLPALKAIPLKIIKLFILSYQGFRRDLCILRASALTLYTLLAIVPVVAMLFGIAKGFGLEKLLEQQLFEQMPQQKETVLTLINFAQNLLDSTKGEVVAGIGVIMLLWTVINMIGNIETSFNFIWKINKSRSFARKIGDYLALMLLAPLLLILSGSITVFLHTKLTWLASLITLPILSEGLVLSTLSLMPVVILVTLFSIILIFMPNHKINYTAGISAGIVTGILYHVAQRLYLSLQIGVSNYNAVYGSFAALPLLVVWIQIGWMIVLLGCEIAFFIQNYESHRHQYNFNEISFFLKRNLGLDVTHLVVKHFVQQAKPLTAEDIALKLHISIAVVQPLLALLVASHILIELNAEDNEDDAYLPAVDSNLLSVAYVINALEHCGENALPSIKSGNEAALDTERWLDPVVQSRLLKEI